MSLRALVSSLAIISLCAACGEDSSAGSTQQLIDDGGVVPGELDIDDLVSVDTLLASYEMTAGDTRAVTCLASDGHGHQGPVDGFVLQVTPTDGMSVNDLSVQATLVGTYEIACALDALIDDTPAVLEVSPGPAAVSAATVTPATTQPEETASVACEAADVVDRLGVLCLESGDRRKAVEQFLKAARIHLDSRDQGRARRTLGRLLELDACNPEGTRLLDELDRLETHPGPTRVDRTPAGSCAAPPRQPFQTPPAIVKTSVSGITTRLRDLKSNDSSDGHTVKGLGDIAAKLKGLGSPSSNDGAAATNTKSDEERAGTSTPPAPVPPPVDSPQDLLLELPETPPSNDPQQTPGQAPATACIEQKLGSAASRLAALREGS